MTVKHRGFMVWPMTASAVQKCIDHGERITQVGLFCGNIQADGSIVGDSSILNKGRELKQKWPHIKVLITLKNDGDKARINPLVQNTNNERTTFFTDLHALLDTYNYLDGVDLDFERIDDNTETDIYSLYQDCWNQVKSRAANRHVHLDLPPMTGPGETVGPEKWCRYEDLDPYCDTVQIMTYGYAWAGSAPGSTSPISWLRDVLTYAVSAFSDRLKIFTGSPAYGHRWQIYDYPVNLGRTGIEETRRGYSGGFSTLLDWPLGYLSHTDQYRTGTETQAYIPFASFYDEEDFHHWVFLHIYDYPDILDWDQGDLVRAEYREKPYATAYSKRQKVSYNEVVNVDAQSYSEANETIEKTTNGGIYPRKPTTAQDGTTEPEPYAKWVFNVPANGTYTMIFNVQFPWFDKQLLSFKLDGVVYNVGNVQQWYPFWRLGHWYNAGTIDLAAGQHTLELDGAASQYETIFYGMKLVTNYKEEYYAGYADFTLKPRHMIDRNGATAWPYENKFKITLETLRRDPEHATIWLDDFRDWQGSLPSNMYQILSGSFAVKKDPNDESSRPYSWVEGSGEFAIKHSGFTDVAVEADIVIKANGRGGVTFGNLWYCVNLNYAGGRLDLYQGSTLLTSKYTSNLEVGDKHPLRMRIRGTEVACFYNGNLQFKYTLASSLGAGAFGVKSDVQISVDRFKGGDAYWYYPQEAIDLTYPDGTTKTIGRIPRKKADGTDLEWHPIYEFFKVPAGMEEGDTRRNGPDGMYSSISKDWDYIHSEVFTLAGPGDYPVSIKMRDVGVWLSTIFLGDADGFSILVFPDALTTLGISDIAAYEFGINGVGMWTIGQEDPMLWNMLVKQV